MPTCCSPTMVAICNYSTLILSGNIVVLLIVAVTTDYWQYRGFNLDNITNYMKPLEGVDVNIPDGTSPYKVITTMMSKPEKNTSLTNHVAEHYHSPMYVRVFDNGSVDSKGHVKDVVQVFLFSQYGNLFRDCDNLTDGIRDQLKIKRIRPEKCVLFMSSQPVPTDASIRIPAALKVEVAAFCTAVLSILCLATSLAAGSLGSLSKSHRYMTIASGLALIAAIILITSIALFNGKTNLQWKGELLPGLKFPHKELILENKIHSYGWSFFLAWICVVLMFTSSFSWLYKAQYLLLPEGDEFTQLYQVLRQKEDTKRSGVSTQYVIDEEEEYAATHFECTV
ncbi:uncharacterized protein LOC124149383 isoform X2 [Haliotis rufescens]|uniref:uncharacterized protein LOC124149383 isoform X1 n=1 Tax=Haliotis rufescens TaxID=6454 RepID=UPI00201E9DFF|nr:uncharacterized protein LOC124149383 isoform X1 [Haliotis rufescens]XP_048248674.1 uncharacterized protein LOC124149383 isoform X2 [Haliotis rufescens]